MTTDGIAIAATPTSQITPLPTRATSASAVDRPSVAPSIAASPNHSTATQARRRAQGSQRSSDGVRHADSLPDAAPRPQMIRLVPIRIVSRSSGG